MTLLGKIFTVLIFIMSLVFMSFATAVYMTHKNWKEVVERPRAEATATNPAGLIHQLTDLRATNEGLRDELRALESELHMERAARANALAALEQDRQIVRAQLKVSATANNQLLAANREAVAAVDSTQKRLTTAISEVTDLRDIIKTTMQDRDKQLDEAIFLTDSLHQARDVQARLQARQSELAAQIARMKLVLDAHDLNEHTPVHNIPPALDGVVLDVRKNFMEVSLGSDDGLRSGHELEVFRNRSYLGRVVVRKTDPDRAVAEIIPQLRKGEMQRGDRVVTKSRLSAAPTTASTR